MAAKAFVSVDGYVTAEVKGEGHASATRRSHSRDLTLRDADTAGAGFSGGFDVKAGVKVKGGVDGKIFTILEKEHSFDIWSHEWPIYQVCRNVEISTSTYLGEENLVWRS